MNQMNEKMIVRVLPAEGSNPEYAPDAELQHGIECYGYILLTFDKEHDVETALIKNLSLKNISDAVITNCDEDEISTIRQAFAIAEGFVKAARIQEDHLRSKAMERVKKVLSGIDPDEEFPDELPQEFPEDPIQLFPDDE